MDKVYLQNGNTEKSLFTEDNFASRRTTGLNMYDPESLLTGAEENAGFGYRDPRVWPSYDTYVKACEGAFTSEDIANIAPIQKLKDILPLMALHRDLKI